MRDSAPWPQPSGIDSDVAGLMSESTPYTCALAFKRLGRATVSAASGSAALHEGASRSELLRLDNA